MDNASCNLEGMCQNFFHPRAQILNQHLYQSPDLTLDETFDVTPSPSSPDSFTSNQPPMESPVNRLIRERLRWIDEQKEAEQSAAEQAVQGLEQLITFNSLRAAAAQRPESNENNNQTQLKVHERVMLESIWKKQVDKSSLKTNLFGGRGIPTAELSVSQVRLGKA
jgi:hypothetical protein